MTNLTIYFKDGKVFALEDVVNLVRESGDVNGALIVKYQKHTKKFNITHCRIFPLSDIREISIIEREEVKA